MSQPTLESELNPLHLLDAFRLHYYRFQTVVGEAITNPTDSTVLARIGDDLDEYAALVHEASLLNTLFSPFIINPKFILQHSQVFPRSELDILQNNLALMRSDIRLSYTEALEGSHHGFPSVVTTIHSGNRGRPQVVFDPDFLAWAYNRRSISALARFLRVGRTTLRNALINHGIMVPQEIPNTLPTASLPNLTENVDPSMENNSNTNVSLVDPADDLLEPEIPLPTQIPQDVEDIASQLPLADPPPATSHTYYHHSTISDDDLDDLIIRLRMHFRRAGIRMISGMLLRLGHRVQQVRIRQSLLRIDPVRRVFERIRIRRRTYSVAGPNALWHHDGQHGKFILTATMCNVIFNIYTNFLGLIRWGIIIHGFIDGYSRLITGLQASSNNTAHTVLTLFLSATAVYGVPSRIRGDHGTENLLVAAWMEERRGERRGSYIWGRYALFHKYLEFKLNFLFFYSIVASTM